MNLGLGIDLHTALWIVYAVAVLLVVVMSSVFMYHWETYRLPEQPVSKMQALYFSVTIPVLVFAGMTLFFV
jgi:hypothetical protein